MPFEWGAVRLSQILSTAASPCRCAAAGAVKSSDAASSARMRFMGICVFGRDFVNGPSGKSDRASFVSAARRSPGAGRFAGRSGVRGRVR